MDLNYVLSSTGFRRLGGRRELDGSSSFRVGYTGKSKSSGIKKTALPICIGLGGEKRTSAGSRQRSDRTKGEEVDSGEKSPDYIIVRHGFGES